MGAKLPWAPALSSSKAPLLSLWVRVGLGKTVFEPKQRLYSKWAGYVPSISHSMGCLTMLSLETKKIAQILEDFAMVYAAKTHGTEIVSVGVCICLHR